MSNNYRDKLDSPGLQPTASVAAVVDSPLDVLAAEAAVDTPPKPPNPIVVEHAKKVDVVSKTTPDGPKETTLPRKYKSFDVVPVGQSIGKLESRRVVGCLDESEAKQTYYEAFGVGANPSALPVNVTLVK